MKNPWRKTFRHLYKLIKLNYIKIKSLVIIYDAQKEKGGSPTSQS